MFTINGVASYHATAFIQQVRMISANMEKQATDTLGLNSQVAKADRRTVSRALNYLRPELSTIRSSFTYDLGKDFRRY